MTLPPGSQDPPGALPSPVGSELETGLGEPKEPAGSSPKIDEEGKEEESGWINWDKKIKEHREKIEKEEREREDLLNKASKKEISWKLLKVCKSFIEENGNSWKESEERRKVEREEEERKSIRMRKILNKKQRLREKKIEEKLTEKWLVLPEKEKI